MSERYIAEERWPGEDVYIVGGGPSLKGLDLDSMLADKHVIGCNSACMLDCVDVGIFGDKQWFDLHRDKLAKVGCELITTNDACLGAKRMLQQGLGISMNPRALAWNGHTGSMAINLAIHFGAARIFLLGFDMCTRSGDTNWYENRWPPTDTVILNHRKATEKMAREIATAQIPVKIYTVAPSALRCWPLVSLESALTGNPQQVMRNTRPGVLIQDIPQNDMPAHLQLLGLFEPGMFDDDQPVTYIHPDVPVRDDITPLLSHRVHFGAMYQPFRKGCPVDLRVVQWTGDQVWMWKQIERNWDRLQDPDYAANWWVNQWLVKDCIPWIRLNGFYEEVTHDAVGAA